MNTTILPRIVAAGLLLALSVGSSWAATAPAPFTATYQVLQGGAKIGEATVSLSAAGNGEWSYQNSSKGTGGIAAMLGASSSETTRFRWNDGTPETISYDSRVQALKTKQRHLTVDPSSHQVSVDDGKGAKQYAGAAGMVDRNTLPYALGLALQSGKQEVMLPVAVKQRVENQQFKVTGKESVQVPAGSFQAEKVARNDDASFNAWYVPAKYLLPVKLSQHDGGDLTLELVSYSAQ
jgi:hypothetical protein